MVIYGNFVIVFVHRPSIKIGLSIKYRSDEVFVNVYSRILSVMHIRNYNIDQTMIHFNLFGHLL